MNLIRRLCISSVTESQGTMLKLCEWTSALDSIPGKFSSVSSMCIEVTVNLISVDDTTTSDDVDEQTHNFSKQPWVVTLLTTPPRIDLKLLFWHPDLKLPCTGKELAICSHPPLAKWLHDQVESRAHGPKTPTKVPSAKESFKFLALPSSI